ncbi:hypothetical protein [uncultured Bradyrhizobium sp.]|jgi:hypothetical protein|uniref:hypothetical protein n=1 Tax=uncultured Bradyrhizobium sp. TaxID=199684 RepID=UPI0026385ED9|nr:hypothetical protein [uncultured Bradyrhizobium sp.]
MSHLILTTDDLAARELRPTFRANEAVGFDLRLVAGKLPSNAELAALLEPRSSKHDREGKHWLDHFRRMGMRGSADGHHGILAFCDRFDSSELWVDPQADAQLIMVWLLDAVRPHKDITSKLSLVQADDRIAKYRSESLEKWKLPAIKITDRHLALASRAWQAWRAPTPEGCFELLMQDTTVLPRLRPAIIALLEELPDSLNGVGASEQLMLEALSYGCTHPGEALYAAQDRGVINEREAGDLFDELAQSPKPLVFGLGKGPFDPDEFTRYHRYRSAEVGLTKLGQAVVEAEDDFSRHNPIKRWWGGTLLTNERLWRWDRESRSLVAP